MSNTETIKPMGTRFEYKDLRFDELIVFFEVLSRLPPLSEKDRERVKKAVENLKKGAVIRRRKMSYKKVCDLCGKEMTSFDKCRKFKIKECSYSLWDGCSWVKIDAHDECVRRLFETVKINPPTPSVGSVPKENT